MTKKKRNKKLKQEFNWVRWGLFAGIAAITLSSAFMNVSGWVSLAATAQQAVANATLSGGMELIALFSLPYAGFMIQRRSYGKGLLALTVAGVAVVINIYATENFLHFQVDTLVNTIETSAATLSEINAQISDLQREVESILARYDGQVPRDAETLDTAYGNLDPDDNPINMRNRDLEIGDRQRYDELKTQIDALRQQRIELSVGANDTARTVIPEEYMRRFVIALELIKATGLYVLGSSQFFMSATERKRLEQRRKWAIIRQKQPEPKYPYMRRRKKTKYQKRNLTR